ncbi:hypothetical protein Ddc_12331 [Ditylenchus destructor]|nr:hypothetical protein Ddc_12331 [Ditylenchus destructor]
MKIVAEKRPKAIPAFSGIVLKADFLKIQNMLENQVENLENARYKSALNAQNVYRRENALSSFDFSHFIMESGLNPGWDIENIG